MYISVETRDALCNAGVTVCFMFFIVVAMLFFVPWFMKRTRYLRCRMRMHVRYRCRIAQIKREERRYKAAMRVFDKPVRWKEM